MQILLIGPSGVGKSTLGKYAADKIDRAEFYDLDQRIARQHDAKDIGEFFREQGSANFLKFSIECLDQLQLMSEPEDTQIIAVGAGTLNHLDSLRSLDRYQKIGIFCCKFGILYANWSWSPNIDFEYYMSNALLSPPVMANLFKCQTHLLVGHMDVVADGERLVKLLVERFGLLRLS